MIMYGFLNRIVRIVYRRNSCQLQSTFTIKSQSVLYEYYVNGVDLIWKFDPACTLRKRVDVQSEHKRKLCQNWWKSAVRVFRAVCAIYILFMCCESLKNYFVLIIVFSRRATPNNILLFCCHVSNKECIYEYRINEIILSTFG